DLQVVPSSAAVSNRLPNAPAKLWRARNRASAADLPRAGSFSRLLGGPVTQPPSAVAAEAVLATMATVEAPIAAPPRIAREYLKETQNPGQQPLQPATSSLPIRQALLPRQIHHQCQHAALRHDTEAGGPTWD